MSRGRGGPSREPYHRYIPPDHQAKNYHRQDSTSLFSRPDPQSTPFSSDYRNPAGPLVHIQPPVPSLIPSAPTLPSHNRVAANAVAPIISHNQNYTPNPVPNSFQYQQVDFLRGQSSEAPQFRTGPRGGGVVPGRLPSFSYQHQSGYSRYPKPNRGRGLYSQDQSFGYPVSVRPSRSTQDPKYLNPNQLRGQNHNQFSNRQWCIQTDSFSEDFKSLSLHQDRPNRGGERFDRHSESSSSGNLSSTKVNITLTPHIQDQVHKALAALKSSESISAKLLAKKLRLPKKIVNKVLYSLERSQKAFKQGLLPPEWALYREHLKDERDQNSEHPSETKFELNAETAQRLGQTKQEDSLSESSSYNCSSLESSDSEEPQTPAKGQEKQHPSTASSPDQEHKLVTMTDQRELVLQYLLNSGEATALVIAKNLGFKTAKQVNPTLYALEQRGDVIKNKEVNPPIWELSTHRRERMERSLKATQSTPTEEAQMELEATGDEMGGGSVPLSSSPLPPIPGFEELPPQEHWIPEKNCEWVSKI